MAMSKMKKLQTPLRIVPRGLDSIIQIVLIDNKTGPYAGTQAEQLANDILKDIADHGNSFDYIAVVCPYSRGPAPGRKQCALPVQESSFSKRAWENDFACQMSLQQKLKDCITRHREIICPKP